MRYDLNNNAGKTVSASTTAMTTSSTATTTLETTAAGFHPPADAEARPAIELPREPSVVQSAVGTAFPILAMLSVCHLLNDMIQSLRR